MKGIFVWLICVMFYFFQFILRSSHGAFADKLLIDLNITMAELSVISSSYYLAYCLLQIPAGIALDKFSYRIILPASFALCLIGSFLFYFQSSFYLACFSRFVIGAGSAFAFLGCTVVAKKSFNKKYIKFALGAVPAVGKSGGFLLISIIPIALLYYSWKSVFLFISLFGVIIFLWMIYIMIKDKTTNVEITSNVKIDFLNILSNPQFFLISMYAAITYLPISVFADTLGILVAKKYYGFDDQASSQCVSILYFGAIIAAPIFSLLLLRFTKKLMFLLTNISSLIFFVILTFRFDIINIYWIFLFIGLSYGPHAFLFSYSNSIFPKSTGTANGFMNTVNILITIIVQLIFGFLFEYIKSILSSELLAFKYSILIIPILLAMSLCILFFFPGNFFKKKDVL